jgi:hypothetical protein
MTLRFFQEAQVFSLQKKSAIFFIFLYASERDYGGRKLVSGVPFAISKDRVPLQKTA